jgi:hypothetical protein
MSMMPDAPWTYDEQPVTVAPHTWTMLCRTRTRLPHPPHPRRLVGWDSKARPSHPQLPRMPVHDIWLQKPPLIRLQ